jgi:hypothetical protein
VVKDPTARAVKPLRETKHNVWMEAALTEGEVCKCMKAERERRLGSTK